MLIKEGQTNHLNDFIRTNSEINFLWKNKLEKITVIRFLETAHKQSSKP